MAKKIKDPVTEYEYSEQDIIDLIAKDLKCDPKDLTIRFEQIQTGFDPTGDDPRWARKHNIIKVSQAHKETVHNTMQVFRRFNVPRIKAQEKPIRRSEVEIFATLTTMIHKRFNSEFNLNVLAGSDKLSDDLGMDFLDKLELVMHAESQFKISIPDEALEKIVTINDAVNAIKECIEAQAE